MSSNTGGDSYNIDSAPLPNAGAETTVHPAIDFTAVMKAQPAALNKETNASVSQVADNGSAQKDTTPDPRVAMHDRIAQLYNVVEQEESDPGKKATWEHGMHLRELGSLDMQTGNLGDGRLCLRAATETLHQAQDKPKDAEMTITESLVDYGRSLLQAPPKQPLELRQRDLDIADQVFGSVIDRAKLEHRSPEDISATMQLKANTDIAKAETNDVKSETGKAAYLADMQTAITDLNGGIGMLAGSNGADNKLSQARLHSELGFVETQVNSTGRNNWYNGIWGAGIFGAGRYDATSEYKQAIDLFHQYNPGNDKQNQVAKDEELLTTLTRYSVLLKSQGDAKAAGTADKEAQAILANHQGWQVKL